MDPVNTMLDRATLDAFVDGALSPEEAARVVLHLADCLPDQTYVDALMETNALLAAAYAAPLHQPLPERLRAAIFPASPDSADARTGWRAALGRPRRALWGALAASCALAVGLGIGLGRRGETPDAQVADAGPLGAAFLSGPEFGAALEARPSGAAETGEGAQLTLIATFMDAAGRPCRQFELLDVADRARTEGVACREAGGGWTPEVAVASRLPAQRSGAGFVPASGEGAEALDATLDRIGAGMTLAPAEEAALIAEGWRP